VLKIERILEGACVTLGHADRDETTDTIEAALKDCREECAKIAEEHCRYVTRLCVPDKEELCTACEIAAAIRGRS